MATCKNCGATSDDPGHLCNPTDFTLHCDYCGTHNVSPMHLCKEKFAAMKYSCGNCGRVAVTEDDLCNPAEIS
jgi:uncharacterized Zn finger protein